MAAYSLNDEVRFGYNCELSLRELWVGKLLDEEAAPLVNPYAKQLRELKRMVDQRGKFVSTVRLQRDDAAHSVQKSSSRTSCKRAGWLSLCTGVPQKLLILTASYLVDLTVIWPRKAPRLEPTSTLR